MVEFRIRISPLKVLKVREISTPEPVDGLVIITDNEDIILPDKANQFKLGKVSILELIDKDEREPVLVSANYERFLF
ncbi:MAG: hypothetical protein BWY45_02947 [Euryarchaeota archaeon ADurb.Bin294]|nr:MAG: hypothetical protein BWY45_02947 [Euryarchaeota archaeon ADurb.Bin294]